MGGETLRHSTSLERGVSSRAESWSEWVGHRRVVACLELWLAGMHWRIDDASAAARAKAAVRTLSIEVSWGQRGEGRGEKDEMTAAGGHVNQSNHTVDCSFPCFWEHSASVLSLLLATDSRNFRRRRRVSPSCLPCLQLPSRQLYSVYASRAVSGGHISPGPIDAARRLMLPHRSLPSQAVSLGSIP